MYEVPSRKDVARVVITEDVVHSHVNPTLVPREPRIIKNDGRHEKSA
jgi:ATP-dependent Clp protease ATP-binding subunit ClpX